MQVRIGLEEIAMNNKKINPILEFVGICFFAAIVIFGITGLCGTLTSGWHLVDDQELFKFEYWMKQLHYSIWKCIQLEYDRMDGLRWRLLYQPARIIMVAMFGTDAFVFSVVKALEAVASMILLYYCARELNTSVFYSVLFSLTCLIGYQSPTFWKLGPGMIQSTVLFGVAFLFLIKYIKTGKLYQGIISFVFLMLMCHFHESYIFVVPFFVVFLVCQILQQRDYNFKEFLAGIKPFAWYAILVSVIFTAIILYMLRKVGTTSYDSVSLSTSIPVSQYITAFINTIHDEMRWYWIFGIILLGILLTFFEDFKKQIATFIMTLSFILPQMVLYSKEGIKERYILPFIIGYALFYVVFIPNSNVLKKKRRVLYSAVLVLMLLINARAAVVEADYYRFRGNSVTNMLEEVEEMSTSGYKVMSCLGNANPEATWTISNYLMAKGEKDIYHWNQWDSAVTDNIELIVDPDLDVDLSDIDVIVAYNRDDRHFMLEPNIDLSGYTYVKCGSLDLYYNDSAAQTLTQEKLDRLRVKPTIYGIGE